MENNRTQLVGLGISPNTSYGVQSNARFMISGTFFGDNALHFFGFRRNPFKIIFKIELGAIHPAQKVENNDSVFSCLKTQQKEASEFHPNARFVIFGAF